MLIDSKISERMFGRSEVLVPAIKLTVLPGIFVDTDVTDVEYYHILFDRHEIIFAEGAPTESLYIGPESINLITPEARAKIQTIFPQLMDGAHVVEPARFIPPRKRQNRLIYWHPQNNKPPLHGVSA